LLERRLEKAGNMPAAEIGSKAAVFFRLDENAVMKMAVVQVPPSGQGSNDGSQLFCGRDLIR
jgi:hypothetical protein